MSENLNFNKNCDELYNKKTFFPFYKYFNKFTKINENFNHNNDVCIMHSKIQGNWTDRSNYDNQIISRNKSLNDEHLKTFNERLDNLTILLKQFLEIYSDKNNKSIESDNYGTEKRKNTGCCSRKKNTDFEPYDISAQSLPAPEAQSFTYSEYMRKSSLTTRRKKENTGCCGRKKKKNYNPDLKYSHMPYYHADQTSDIIQNPTFTSIQPMQNMKSEPQMQYITSAIPIPSVDPATLIPKNSKMENISTRPSEIIPFIFYTPSGHTVKEFSVIPTSKQTIPTTNETNIDDSQVTNLLNIILQSTNKGISNVMTKVAKTNNMIQKIPNATYSNKTDFELRGKDCLALRTVLINCLQKIDNICQTDTNYQLGKNNKLTDTILKNVNEIKSLTDNCLKEIIKIYPQYKNAGDIFNKANDLTLINKDSIINKTTRKPSKIITKSSTKTNGSKTRTSSFLTGNNSGVSSNLTSGISSNYLPKLLGL